ncbi:MAG: aminotransferase class I/II-fold pyridoxal phosphate-dependent enzyme [Cyanothece sp. SIO1E1]|nr:aminotransferase class I/II-fold pyridoxal phosphate-dependent enzyme [Cyanothece sp. SIO1E1]
MSQETMPLLAALRASANRDQAAFYTPGHKGGQGTPQSLLELLGADCLRADLPELPELDNLFAPEGVIQQAQALAAEAFGAERTWFLANGSTCGIQAAVLATCNPGDKIIMPRNVHQSAIAALILSGAVPIFVPPDYDPQLALAHSITPAALATALEKHPDTKAVMTVYPTYYGVCGDLEAIAHITHQHHIPLLVDEAHGPHFAFHPDLPIPALAAGADLTVQSTHKVLAALTQAAMLHTQGAFIDPDRISKALQLVQSTSPNYLLLASLDAARQQMALQGQALLGQTLKLANQARDSISQIPGVSVLSPNSAGLTPGFQTLDPTRLTVDVSSLGLTGFAADEILHQQLGVTAELPSLRQLTFIISLGNTATDVERLVQAVETLQCNAWGRGAGKAGVMRIPVETLHRNVWDPKNHLNIHKTAHTQNSFPPLTPRQAFFAPTETIPLNQSLNRISAELVCPYPPGIPVLLPGEQVSEEAIAYLKHVIAAGGVITGCADVNLRSLQVVPENISIAH